MSFQFCEAAIDAFAARTRRDARLTDGRPAGLFRGRSKKLFGIASWAMSIRKSPCRWWLKPWARWPERTRKTTLNAESRRLTFPLARGDVPSCSDGAPALSSSLGLAGEQCYSRDRRLSILLTCSDDRLRGRSATTRRDLHPERRASPATRFTNFGYLAPCSWLTAAIGGIPRMVESIAAKSLPARFGRMNFSERCSHVASLKDLDNGYWLSVAAAARISGRVVRGPQPNHRLRRDHQGRN